MQIEQHVMWVLGDLSLRVVEGKKVLPRKLQREVDRIWKREPNVFDGSVLAFVEFREEEGVLIGKKVPYRWVLAGHRKPKLRAQLGCMPIAVSGLVACDGHLLVGRRGTQVTQYPGYYEFVPSGGVEVGESASNEIDWRRQLALELEEEAGIALSASQVEAIKPFSVICDYVDHIVEICARIDLEGGRGDGLCRTETKEYSEILWVDKQLCSEMIDAETGTEEGRFVPTSVLLYYD